MARARIGSLPARSASRITPRRQGLRLAALAGVEAHHFQRAAADIGEDAVGGGDAAEHPLGGVFGFLDAGQDTDRDAGQAGFQGGDEIRAVAGVAHGGGGEHLERLGTHGTGDGVVAVQHGEGLRHAVLIQPAGGGQAAAEAQHRLLVKDAHWVAAVAFEHHQADRVGPEVHHATAGHVRRRLIGHAFKSLRLKVSFPPLEGLGREADQGRGCVPAVARSPGSSRKRGGGRLF